MKRLRFIVIVGLSFSLLPARASGQLLTINLLHGNGPGRCSGQGNAEYNIDVTDPSNSNGALGLKADMYAYSSEPGSCYRVSSLAAWNYDALGHLHMVEVGWYQGYGQQSGELNPQVFYYVVGSVGADGEHKTSYFPPLDTTANYEISDTNQDGIWGVWYRGTKIANITEGIPPYYGGINSERDNTNAVLRGHFYNIRKYHSSNGWSNWSASCVYFDNDPPNYLHQHSTYEWHVHGTSGGTTC
jgi:hypothetical protein